VGLSSCQRFSGPAAELPQAVGAILWWRRYVPGLSRVHLCGQCSKEDEVCLLRERTVRTGVWAVTWATPVAVCWGGPRIERAATLCTCEPSSLGQGGRVRLPAGKS